MKRASTLFFQILTVLIGIGVLVFMLWEPHLEGRNVGTKLFEIYFKDPFLAYAYIGSIPFFMALYQIVSALSRPTVTALRKIRRYTIVFIGFVVLGELFIMSNTSDDAAGAVALGVLVILGSSIVALVARRLERTMQKGVNQG